MKNAKYPKYFVCGEKFWICKSNKNILFKPPGGVYRKSIYLSVNLLKMQYKIVRKSFQK